MSKTILICVCVFVCGLWLFQLYSRFCDWLKISKIIKQYSTKTKNIRKINTKQCDNEFFSRKKKYYFRCEIHLNTRNCCVEISFNFYCFASIFIQNQQKPTFCNNKLLFTENLFNLEHKKKNKIYFLSERKMKQTNWISISCRRIYSQWHK